MTDVSPATPAPSSGVDGLLEDFRRRREALWQEASQLAQLQAEVLGATERDAAAILVDARMAIGHILNEARRDLKALSKRVDVIARVEEEEQAVRSSPSKIESATTRQSLSQARRDLSRVLDEAKPEIEALGWEASKLGGVVHDLAPGWPPEWRAASLTEMSPLPRMVDTGPVPTPIDMSPAPPPNDAAASLAVADSLSAVPDRTFLDALPPSFRIVLQSDSVRVWLAALGIAALLTLLGAVLIMRLSPRAAARGAAPSKAAPSRPMSNDGSAPMTSAERTPATLRGQTPTTWLANAKPEAAPPAELTTAAQQWLDAYARHDTEALRSAATSDVKLSDQRDASERLPPGAEGVRRTLESVSFLLVGGTSILAARLIEQGNVKGQNTQRISWISLMWIREGGQLKVADVQILSEAKLHLR